MSRSPFRLPFSSVALLLAVSCGSSPGESASSASHPGGDTVRARVVRAGDGDTIDVLIGSRRERVRLVGVDTPELGDTDPKTRALAKEAHAFTERALVGVEVELVADPRGDDRDKYGRLLRYVLVGGRNHNEALVREGYACVYRAFDYGLKGKFLELEKGAQRAHPDRDPCADRKRKPGH